MEKEKVKKAYQEVFEVCEKYADEKYLSDYKFDDIRDMRDKAKNHLMLIYWYEKYGLNIEHDKQIYKYNHFNIADDRYFSYYGDAEAERGIGSGRYISWSDDGKQPKDEWLFCISFSTGVFIFGEDYPENIFQKFWQELKSYGPKYCDTHNNTLYFSLENAKKIFDEYPDILAKYQEINKRDSKKRKIEKLKKELSELLPKSKK